MWALHVAIYEEPPYPVVEHVFRGRTKREAEGYYRSHLKTDDFLRACVVRGKFRDLDCRYEAYWRRS